MATDFHTSAYGKLVEDMHRTWHFLSITMAVINHIAILIEGAISEGTEPREVLRVDSAVLDRIACGDADKRQRLEELQEDLPNAWDTFAENVPKEHYHHTIMEMSLSRNVDAFNYYMVRMLNYVFEQNRTSLSEKDQRALTGKSDDERDEVLDKIVDAQLRRGLRSVIQYLIDNMGFCFDSTTDTFAKADEYIAVRNLGVHNAGRVNRRFLTRTKRTDLDVGDVFPLTLTFVTDGYHTFHAMVKTLDAEIVEQFDLFTSDRQQQERAARKPGYTSPQPGLDHDG